MQVVTGLCLTEVLPINSILKLSFRIGIVFSRQAFMEVITSEVSKVGLTKFTKSCHENEY